MRAGCLALLLAGELAILVSACDAADPGSVREVENHPDQRSVLVLSDGSRFETTLFEVRVLGTLRTARKAPYLILEGRGCRECDANTSIYIHSISDGPMRNEAGQPRYKYPGREVSYEDGKTLLYESKAFVGDCLADHDNAVVWYERFPTQTGAFEMGVFVASVRQDSLRNERLGKPLPPIARSLERVAAGRCRELPGIDRHSEP
jgi:hypothetical protein